MNLYKTSGYLSLVFGALCCIFIVLLVLTDKPLFLMLSLLNTFLGFISSIINIFLNAKYEISKKNFSMGFAGLILSSVPVVFLMILILKR
jgi:hypothetical protein